MKKIEYININVLHPHPDNPRKDLGDLTELADSITAKGVLQNLTVVPDTQDGGYRIIIGHRRHAAAKLAGLTDLPCVIADMTPQEQFETMMVENVQRSDLTTYEQAEGFQMMLDMGSTVEEVAKKTGFSPTTIRSRIKLTALDKEKFRKAELRGATLSDYLKLNEIKDPETRNKVLDSVGTADFNIRLKNALDEQKFMDELAAAIQFVQSADWIKEKTDEDTSYKGDYSTYRTFDRWNRKPFTTPTDTDKATYIYSIREKEVYIFRKGPASEKKKTPEEAKKDRYKKKAERIDVQLRQISKNHRELREAFIKDFTSFNNYQMDIEAFAANALLSFTYGTVDVELLGRITGIKVDKGKLDMEMWNKMLFNHPMRGLLYATFAKVEKIGSSYASSSWNDKMSCLIPRHQTCELMDLVYDGLVSLGYEMCEEEIQMQKGTHPLFKKAGALYTEFKKEKV